MDATRGNADLPDGKDALESKVESFREQIRRQMERYIL